MTDRRGGCIGLGGGAEPGRTPAAPVEAAAVAAAVAAVAAGGRFSACDAVPDSEPSCRTRCYMAYTGATAVGHGAVGRVRQPSIAGRLVSAGCTVVP